MVDSLRDYAVAPVPDFMRDEKFKTYIETIIPFLLTTGNTDTLVINPSDGNINAFDLSGFLLDRNIGMKYHYIIMRMNDLTSVHDLDEEIRTLVIPDFNVLEELIQLYRSPRN